jgi:uncharacterized protein
MDNQFLFVSWPEYHLLAQKLAATIISHSDPFDEIVAIARGGLTLGHVLSDLLQLPVATFTIQSYTDIQKQGKVTITQELGLPIAGKRILLVDDIADTGKTFIRAMEYVHELKPAHITTVSMFFKPHSTFRPDYIAKQTDKWIVLPYEVVETITFVTKTMAAKKKTKSEIQDFLISLGFNVKQIAFVRKYHITHSQ